MPQDLYRCPDFIHMIFFFFSSLVSSGLQTLIDLGEGESQHLLKKKKQIGS